MVGWMATQYQRLAARAEADKQYSAACGCLNALRAMLIQPQIDRQIRQLAASMGHDVRTHMKHYGQWTDEAGLDAAFGAANAKLTASLTKRQQQMQQQQ